GVRARVEKEVARKVAAEILDLRVGNTPGRDGAVDGNEDRHSAGGSPARHVPLRPPDFSSNRMSRTIIPLSIAFAMSYSVSAATATAVSASISTPVDAVVRTRASMS